MAEFQEDDIDHVVSKVESLSDLQVRLLKYIESRGRTLPSQKQWAQATFGSRANQVGTTTRRWAS